MKRQTSLLLTVAVLGFGVAARAAAPSTPAGGAADPVAPPNPAEAPPGRIGPRGPRPDGASGRRAGPADDDRPLDRWMNVLKRRSPEEFQRLETLRQNDPEAFRREMLQKLEDARKRFGEHRSPNGEPHGGRHGWFPDQDPETMQAARRLVGELHRAVSQYRGARDDTERDTLREQIRGAVSRLFDLKEQERQRRIDRMDGELTRLRREIEERRAAKDQIVQQRVEELTAPPPPEGAPPPPPAPPM